MPTDSRVRVNLINVNKTAQQDPQCDTEAEQVDSLASTVLTTGLSAQATVRQIDTPHRLSSMDEYATFDGMTVTTSRRILTSMRFTTHTETDTLFHITAPTPSGTIASFETKFSVLEAVTPSMTMSVVTIYTSPATTSQMVPPLRLNPTSASASTESSLSSTVNSISQPTTQSDSTPHYGSGVLAGISLGVFIATLTLLLIGCFCFRRHRLPHHKSPHSSLRSFIGSKLKQDRVDSNEGTANAACTSGSMKIAPLQFGDFMTDKKEWDGTSFTKRSNKSFGEPGPAFDGVEVIPVKPGPAFFREHHRRDQLPALSNTPSTADSSRDPKSPPMPIQSPGNPAVADSDTESDKTVKAKESLPYCGSDMSYKHNSAQSTISESTIESIDRLKHGSAELVYVGEARTEDMYQARRNSFMPKVVNISPSEIHGRSRSLSPDRSFKSSLDKSFHTGDSTKLAKHYDVNRWEYRGL